MRGLEAQQAGEESMTRSQVTDLKRGGGRVMEEERDVSEAFDKWTRCGPRNESTISMIKAPMRQMIQFNGAQSPGGLS